ncbi:MAG: NAD-dependent epimerase [Porticoccaceae bacterium]
MRILVTGVAGFVGFHVAMRLLREGHIVTGVDNMNDYYDKKLKTDRLSNLIQDNFSFHEIDLSDSKRIFEIFQKDNFEVVIHLAAQAGVRYSIENPSSYIESNLMGFSNILEACRFSDVTHLVYASSSSVYGINKKVPFSESHDVSHPLSLYAATKKSNELMAHSYSHLYRIPTTGLRFFTVYGPWGRPDMAYFMFTDSIIKGKPIKVFNEGHMFRDFTYIDDIVEGIYKVMLKPPKINPRWNRFSADASSSSAPYQIFNIGNNKTVSLGDFIQAIERLTGKAAKKLYLPMQDGDVESTWADIEKLENLVGYKPKVEINEGLKNFVDWYRRYYKR